MNNQVIFALFGLGGSGKSTISKWIQEGYSSVKRMVPYTLRMPRATEEDGVDYHFINPLRFEELAKAGKFMEHRMYTICNSNGVKVNSGYAHEWPTEEYNLMDSTELGMIKAGAFDSFISGGGMLIPIILKAPAETRLYRMIQRELHESKPNWHELSRRFISDEKYSYLYTDTNIHNIPVSMIISIDISQSEYTYMRQLRNALDDFFAYRNGVKENESIT